MSLKINLKTYVNDLKLSSADGMSKLKELLATTDISTDVSWGKRTISFPAYEGSISLAEISRKVCQACKRGKNSSSILYIPATQDSNVCIKDWVNRLTVVSLLKEHYESISIRPYCCLNKLLLWICDFFNQTKKHLDNTMRELTCVTNAEYNLITEHLCYLEEDGEWSSEKLHGYKIAPEGIETLIQENLIRKIRYKHQV